MKTLLLLIVAQYSIFFTYCPVYSQYNTTFEEETFKLVYMGKQAQLSVFDVEGAKDEDELPFKDGKQINEEPAKEEPIKEEKQSKPEKKGKKK